MRFALLAAVVALAPIPGAVAQAATPEVPPADWPAALPAPDSFRLFLPDRPWALVLNLDGFSIESTSQTAQRASVRLKPVDASSSFIASAFLEDLPGIDGASACRTFYPERGKAMKLPLSDVRVAERDGKALHESTVARVGGVQLDQRSVHVYLDEGDTCVDVHVSKTLFTAADQPRLDALVDAVRIEKPFAPTAVDWLPFALAGDCASAMPALESIERAEAVGHRLDRPTWRATMLRLATCRATVDGATRTLEAAVREDPGHAAFHYELAAVRATAGDVPGALEGLRRAKALPSEDVLPDPLASTAFDPIEADPAFREGVAALFEGPPATTRSVILEGTGASLALDVPGGWRVRREPSPMPAPTYELRGPRGARHATVVVSVLPTALGPPATPREMRRLVAQSAPERTGRTAAPALVTDLPDGPVKSACVMFEDPALAGKEAPLREWKHLTHCMGSVDGVVFTATVFTQVPDAPERPLALAMLATARRERPAAAGR